MILFAKGQSTLDLLRFSSGCRCRLKPTAASQSAAVKQCVPAVLSFIVGGLLLRFELFVADTEFIAPVAHEFTQLLDAQVRYFMHADQQRSADRQSAMADLADDGRSDFERPRQRRIVIQT